MWTKAFWKDTIERAIKTVAQAAASIVAAAEGLGLLDIDWGDTASIAALAGLLSILTSVGSAKTGTIGTAQLAVSDYTYIDLAA